MDEHLEDILKEYTLEEILELNNLTVLEILEDLVERGIVVLPVV